MTLLDLVQALLALGGTNRHSEAVAPGVFEYDHLHIGCGVIGPLGSGALICALVVWDQEWGYQQILMLVAGMIFIAVGIWVATGARRILVEGDIVTAEYGGGRRRSWRLQDLYVSRVLGAVVIRERKTGKVAFNVTQQLLGWEELLSLIGLTGGRRDGLRSDRT